MNKPTETPRALGYRWPAEWEPHVATWCSWPHRRATWPNKFAPVPTQFTNLISTLSEFEPVRVLAGGDSVMAEARRHLDRLRHVTLHDIPTNDAWCRDSGPIFLAGPAGAPPALVDWDFNAWGGKYPQFDEDNAIPRRIAELQHRLRFTPGMVLEGGSVEGNGTGTILTTRQCLLNPNRNPTLGQADIERYLADFLGADQVIWLSGGELVGDDTDGHIDQLARFVDARTIVVAVESNERDPNYAPLRRNWLELEAACDTHGRAFQLVPLPMPSAKEFRGQRLPASYLNFYLANGAVLVPQYGDPLDLVALRTLSDLFPGRTSVGLPALDLVLGLGSFHCMTQQEPQPSRAVG